MAEETGGTAAQNAAEGDGTQQQAAEGAANTPGLTDPGGTAGTAGAEGTKDGGAGPGIPGLTNPEGGTDDKGGEGKEGDKEGPKEGEAQGYKLSVPEGFVLDEKMVADASPLLQKYKVSNEDAQALSDLVCQKVRAEQDARSEAYAEVVKGWQKGLMEDKAIGGEKLTPALKTGLKALNRFGDSELTEILHDTGLEYHPAVVRFFHKIGLAISEDGGSGAQHQAAKKEVPTASMFYGK